MSAPNWKHQTIWTGDNLQLLCGWCNSLKGTKTQAEFKNLLYLFAVGGVFCLVVVLYWCGRGEREEIEL